MFNKLVASWIQNSPSYFLLHMLLLLLFTKQRADNEGKNEQTLPRNSNF
jgi:hypothetical protein